MNSFRADLHCHTTCSDGTYTPAELVAYAKEIGLSGIAITDHDTVNAYKKAIPAAKKEGIWLGSGVEFSSYDQGVSIHVLGYDFSIDHPGIISLCKRHIQRRLDRNQKILDKLAKKGMKIDEKELVSNIKKGRTVGRPHIALALLEAGYVRSIQEAFDRFIGDRMPCFDPGNPISTDETIDILHKAGGKVFLAHPHLIGNNREIKNLMNKPLDGIECYYSKCTPDQEKKWVKIAIEKGLLISGGSDFHGAIKPNIPLGCSWVNEETFHQIFETNKWH